MSKLKLSDEDRINLGLFPLVGNRRNINENSVHHDERRTDTAQSVKFFPESNPSINKNRSTASVSGFLKICTPDETYLERSQLGVEQFLALLRFENRGKFEELTIALK